ncbi:MULTISPECIES: M50 family metallopeptidase [unclassified Bacillus (in: firmicutes)]|uniref:M50 family metallopeptidase n=1 Tax=unclassified Bacillus (in: firmicutes) TaxID=185979 RepID=UPI000D025C8D|nr:MULTISPECIES: M50 family metallopeptidase [unclassified Bacillus (in: firmicutes)]PRR93378.1 stage IV sporulation protein FB [Bacillus sp. NMCN1]PRS00930.1 stage IV sporulation protein FB [Bacillus sp. NMCN6]
MNRWLLMLTKIHIHPLLWIVMAFAILSGQIKPLLCLLIIVFVHELGHSAAACYYHWRIRRIFLLPFGGAVEVEEHGNRPLKEELAVILCGPLQHVPLQLMAWIFMETSLISHDIFTMFTFYNMAIFLVNLLPIWPLDGGKLFFLLLSAYYPFQRAHALAIKGSLVFFGLLTAGLLLFAPLQFNGWMLLTFLAYSLAVEHRQRHYVRVRFLLERYYGKKEQKVEKLIPLRASAEEKVYEVMARFQRGCKHPIIIERDGVKMSQLDENELLHAYFSDRRTTSSMEELLLPY